VSGPIHRITDGVRRLIHGNMQGAAYLADPGKRLVGECIDDVVCGAGGAIE
jgi:hypothetical protein